MDGPRNYHNKQSKSEREKQVPYNITYTWNIKQMNISAKRKQIHRHRQQTYGCQGEVVGEGRIGSLG